VTLSRPVKKMGKLNNRIKAFGITYLKPIHQRVDNPTRTTKPIFLVGCGRSGTNMLVFRLEKSWQIELFNENHPAAFQNFRIRDLATIEEVIDRSYAGLALFKPILSTPQTPILLTYFPTSQAIFVFRHYNDVINSSIKRFGLLNRLDHVNAWVNDDFAEFGAYQPPEKTKEIICSLWAPTLSPETGAALYWIFYNQLFIDMQLNQNGRVLLVRYESIVNNPKSEFEKICSFLNLRFEKDYGAGLFSTSVKKNAPPDIEEKVREVCDNLWFRLCQDLGVSEEFD
jgi:hypothetical protein